MPVPHFSPWDFNWPFGFPPDAQQPDGGPPIADTEADKSDRCPGGSVIVCQNQALGEDVSITGTSFGLHYESDRARGRKTSNILRIPVSGPTVPASAQQIDVLITVAGRTFTQKLRPAPNLITTFEWDGKDAYGRFEGSQLATIRIGYGYPGVFYAGFSDFRKNFGLYSPKGEGAIFGADRGSRILSLWRTEHAWVGSLSAKGVGLGGWTLDVHHAYDPQGHVAYFGDGTRRNGQGLGTNVVDNVAGTGDPGSTGDNGPAIRATLASPSGATVAPDGTVYFADRNNNRIRRIAPDGTISTVAGAQPTGTRPFSEGQLAASAVGDQLEVALEVTRVPDGEPLTATVLERGEQGSYRRSSRALRVHWGPGTSLVMGRTTDLRPGAVVQALATTIGLAYWLRRAPPVTPEGERVPLLERLRPHFWLGFGIAPITFAHLWPAVSEGWARRVDQPGLYLAYGAFLLTIGQVVLGMRLRDVHSRSRRTVRGVHFWTMAAIAALTVGHVAINSTTVRILFG